MNSGSNHSALTNEPEIIEQAKSDDQAFELLYNHYFPKIYGYVQKRVGSRETAEDIVSEVFLKVFTNLKSYQQQGYSFGAWLYRIATNAMIDHYRKAGRQRQVNLEDTIEPADPKTTPDLLAQKNIDRDIIQEIIKKLSKRDQQVISLKYFAEMSHEEIAEIISVKPNNARVILHRALKNFQKIYQNYEK